MNNKLFFWGILIALSAKSLSAMEVDQVCKKRKFDQKENIASVITLFNTMNLGQATPPHSPEKKAQKTAKNQGPSFTAVPKAPRHAAPVSRRDQNRMDDGTKEKACKNLKF
jgi:hypothetical protein